MEVWIPLVIAKPSAPKVRTKTMSTLGLLPKSQGQNLEKLLFNMRQTQSFPLAATEKWVSHAHAWHSVPARHRPSQISAQTGRRVWWFWDGGAFSVWLQRLLKRMGEQHDSSASLYLVEVWWCSAVVSHETSPKARVQIPPSHPSKLPTKGNLAIACQKDHGTQTRRWPARCQEASNACKLNQTNTECQRKKARPQE